MKKPRTKKVVPEVDPIESFVKRIRKDARWQYKELLEEGYEPLEADFSAEENTYDEYVDQGYDPAWVGLALREYKSKEADDGMANHVHYEVVASKRPLMTRISETRSR